MASSSASFAGSSDNRALPLIPCPYCGGRLTTKISRGGKRPGVRYYMCELYSDGGCTFFQWRELYAGTFQEYAGQAEAPIGAAGIVPGNRAARTIQVDLGRINLFVSLINTMAILIVLAVLLSAYAAAVNK